MAAAPDQRPLAIAPGQATAVWFLGQALEIKLTGEQTGGSYAVTEADELDPGFGPPPHIHRREDEALYVIDGEFLFTIDGEEHSASTGAFVRIPKGLMHSWKNVGGRPGKLLTIYTPAGLEGWFEELGEPITDRAGGPATAPDTAALVESARAYGLEIALPAGAESS